MPPWQEINIRCHDFRVTCCTMCYNAQIPLKTLQIRMGHTDTQLILKTYTKLEKEKEKSDAGRLNAFINETKTVSSETMLEKVDVSGVFSSSVSQIF